jgi:hypothetical protein
LPVFAFRSGHKSALAALRGAGKKRDARLTRKSRCKLFLLILVCFIDFLERFD